MVIESIRELNCTVLFLPNEIRMASGERFVAPHRDFISISPRGSLVVSSIGRHDRTASMRF
jgi:hypothetical protein